MKIPRYSQGQTNIGMLEQGRAALQSPQEAAAAAAGKYEAVKSISDIAASGLDAFTKAKEATQLADDELAFSRQSLITTTQIDQAYNDANENDLSADRLNKT